MAAEAEHSSKGGLSGAVRLVFLFASLGVLFGVWWAVSRLFLEGTLAEGFRHTAFTTLKATTVRLALAGAVLGILFVLGGFLVRRIAPPLRRAMTLGAFIDFCRSSRPGPWPYLVIQTLGLGVAAVSFLFSARSSRLLLFAVAGAIALCLLLAFLRSVARRSADPGGPALRGFFAGFFGGLVFFLLAAAVLWCFVHDPRRKFLHLFSHKDLLLASAVMILVALAVFLLFRSHAVLAARLETSGGRGPFGRPFTVLFSLAAVVLCLLPGDLVPSRLAARNPKNVILIGIDTLRLDHTNLLSEKTAKGRDLTPNLRRLAARGTVFTTAVSQAPWTLPAFSSIITGEYPCDHGAVSIFGELRGRRTTLAEVLKEAGYATGAVVSHLFVDRDHGFSQGFDYFNQQNSLGHWAITSGGVTDLAVSYLGKKRNKPFFLFLHYFDPHNAYRHHEGWHFADAYKGWLRDQPQDISMLRNQRQALDKADIAYLSDLYDEEIAYTDQQIGRLLDFLRSRGLDEDTAIIVVADHGEEFMERGWLGHSASLYDELIRVPLLMVLPGVRDPAKTSKETVETRSVFSTILDYVGVDWSGDGDLPPPSLLDLVRGKEPKAGNEAFAGAFSSVGFPEFLLKKGEPHLKILSYRTSRWKVIHDYTRHREFLFDLAADPGEKNNLSREKPEKMKELLGRLDAWASRVEDISPGPSASEGDAAERDKLKALGYVH